MNLIKNTVYKFELGMINKKGNFVSGLTISYNIYKSSDNSLFDSGIMNEINTSGVYQTNSITFTIESQYRIEYITPNKFENIVSTLLVEESINSVSDKINRLLGLSQENYRIFNQTYDKYQNLTSALIKLYPTANDCDNDTNSFAEYEMSATWDSKRRLTGYKTKRTV